jgi:hypothetical protein
MSWFIQSICSSVPYIFFAIFQPMIIKFWILRLIVLIHCSSARKRWAWAFSNNPKNDLTEQHCKNAIRFFFYLKTKVECGQTITVGFTSNRSFFLNIRMRLSDIYFPILVNITLNWSQKHIFRIFYLAHHTLKSNRLRSNNQVNCATLRRPL